MKRLLALVAVLTSASSVLLAGDAPTRKADREILLRLNDSFFPAFAQRDAPIERAIERYLQLLSTEWRTPQPIKHRIERGVRRPNPPPEPAVPSEIITFSFSARQALDGLREMLAIADWSFTIRDGVFIFSNTQELYRDEIWRLPKQNSK